MQKFIDAAKRPVILQGIDRQVALLNLTYDNLVDLLAGWGAVLPGRPAMAVGFRPACRASPHR